MRLIGVDGDLFPIGQKMRSAIVNTFDAGDRDGSGLTWSNRVKIDPAGIAGDDADGPLAIRGKASGAPLAEKNGRCPVHLPESHRVILGSSLAGVFE